MLNARLVFEHVQKHGVMCSAPRNQDAQDELLKGLIFPSSDTLSAWGVPDAVGVEVVINREGTLLYECSAF